MPIDKAKQVVQVPVTVEQIAVLRDALLSYRTKQHYAWCRHVGKKAEDYGRQVEQLDALLNVVPNPTDYCPF
jgi:galactose-1-phosphate uridylyltransferase